MLRDKMECKMSKHSRFRPAFKVWIEYEGKSVLGEGGATILERVKKEGSITTAAEKLGMSYRYVWNYLNEIKEIIGEPVVKTFKGGKSGGGGAELTELGEYLLREYRRASDAMEHLVLGKN